MTNTYFNDLNYTLSNEDTRVEYQLMKPNLAKVFSIGGSGARVLPLIARSPKQIDIVDLSYEQIALIELRIAAARHLSRDEFLFFLGYRGGIPNDSNAEDSRLTYFSRLPLSEKTRRFWLERQAAWTPRGFIFLGRWEGHFQKIGHVFRNVLRIDTRPIFEAHSIEEQRRLFQKHFRPLIFKTFIKVAASELVFNRFLYRGHFSGRASVRTERLSPSDFILSEFDRLFTKSLVRKNYFLQVLFLGGVLYEEGLPLEARADILEQIRTSATEVHLIQSNLIDVVKRDGYDFLSLSDTISYLPQEIAESLLQSLSLNTPSESTVVIRSFLRRPENLVTTGWTRLEREEEAARNLDTTGVYQFDIFKKP